MVETRPTPATPQELADLDVLRALMGDTMDADVALAAEVAFYQSVTADPAFAPLRPFVPKFYGTLRLEGKLDESQPQAEGGPLKVVQASTGEKDEYSWFGWGAA